ncbi:ornithine carbamoyltransferase [Lacticaseibacillus thailandensis]|uniref:Ornithine carbamoyltransferase n=1 Tax=Lacticaseibacillus thailandensis DSM 22698 = JCM 13996 TaxID=1423810 RepID=A0A0R2C663_9LACO|nr:ornithine carbamoyltransferase [Lacticaseibacillus thailandensis]KRM86842.1 ornithine carbamoyltransferase [Lacticaseibacillus thailandensis DSM 22698 = JCM 13996]
MYNQFHQRSLLAEKDFTGAEFYTLIKFAEHLKDLKAHNIEHHYLTGKNVALLFAKTSTRTRSAFTVAATDLGAHPEFLGAHDIQLGNKESLADTAKVLGSMYDGIEYRGFAQSTVAALAQYSGIPVWNGLTDDWHPTQMLADFMTIDELCGHVKGITLTYLGDARNNVANSLLVTAAMLGANIHLVGPQALQPAAHVQTIAQQFAAQSGSDILITDDLVTGLAGSDVLYTDVWASMGEEDAWAQRIKLLQPYQLNMDAVTATHNPNVIVLHDLPAFHDLNTTMGQQIHEEFGLDELEITDEVFNAPFAHQFQQAANRLHTIKAVMAATLGNPFIPTVIEPQ